jgi:hypothetical protein
MSNTVTTEACDPNAIFDEDGPINPTFMQEAIRTLMRAMPLDPDEPEGWSNRRMYSALCALATLNPRDEIEVMLGVQALSAYHAAGACWRLGMNSGQPNGNSTRHITAAASAARTFDSLLRALERRQARPPAAPVGRPPARKWAKLNATRFMAGWNERCGRGEFETVSEAAPEPERSIVWTPEDLAIADERREAERIEKENEGLDIANTEGILPGGGMILPDDPTPQQAAYIGRRLGLMYKREYEENLRKGIKKIPKIRPIRTGDLIP